MTQLCVKRKDLGSSVQVQLEQPPVLCLGAPCLVASLLQVLSDCTAVFVNTAPEQCVLQQSLEAAAM